jgi:PEGA domain
MVSRGPFVLEVSGHTFHFELHDYGGPFVLGKRGQPLGDQPGARSLFWEAYWQWERQGKQVDDQGRCIFKWETAPVHITQQVGHPLLVAPTTPPAPPELTAAPCAQAAKVKIRSTPQDADIFADGKFVGNAPAVLTLPVGKHQFRVLLKNYEEWSKELELIPDSELTLVAKLVKLAKQTSKP